MNESTLLTNVKSRLVAQTWTGSSNVVFATGSVLVTANLPEAVVWALNTGLRTPFALIAPMPAESDPEFNEEPDWIRFNFAVLLATVVPGGTVGEEAVMGANKTGGSTSSEGRGIVELQQEFYNAVGKLNALENITLQIRQQGEHGGTFHDPNYIVWRTLLLEAWGTAT